MNSMTGFGRSDGQVANLAVTVEAKSVNHRFLDVRLRLPAALSSFEPGISELVRSRFQRGSLEVVIKQKLTPEGGGAGGNVRFTLDEKAAASFIEVCNRLHMAHQTQKCPSLEAILMTGKVIVPLEEPLQGEDQLDALSQLVNQALDGLQAMRREEGTKLKAVLEAGTRNLVTLTEEIAKLATQHTEKIRTRLDGKISQWGLNSPADPQRLEWEIAYYAERSDITEEVDRLRSHARAFLELLQEAEPVGRKLEFLTQEMHREVNTIGSKSAMVEITRHTVEAKTVIEKLREQIQNVE